jgi:hypothetical protein
MTTQIWSGGLNLFGDPRQEWLNGVVGVLPESGGAWVSVEDRPGQPDIPGGPAGGRGLPSDCGLARSLMQALVMRAIYFSAPDDVQSEQQTAYWVSSPVVFSQLIDGR